MRTMTRRRRGDGEEQMDQCCCQHQWMIVPSTRIRRSGLGHRQAAHSNPRKGKECDIVSVTDKSQYVRMYNQSVGQSVSQSGCAVCLSVGIVILYAPSFVGNLVGFQQ